MDIRVLVAPKWGLVGDTQTPGGDENGFKTAERNFVKTVKISGQSEKCVEVIKNFQFRGGTTPLQMPLTVQVHCTFLEDFILTLNLQLSESQLCERPGRENVP